MEEENRKKYILIIAVVIFLVMIVFFLLFKITSKKPQTSFQLLPLPPGVKTGSPEEAAIRFLQWEQEGNRVEAVKHLFPFNIIIFRERYSDLRSLPGGIIFEKSGPPPEFRIIESKIEGDQAEIVVEETSNRKEGMFFINFVLPRKVIFSFQLINYRGSWKVVEIDSPDLVEKRQIVEEGKFDNVHMKILEIENYQKENINPPEGFKFLSLKIEYINNSNRDYIFFPFNEWSILSVKERKVFGPIPPRQQTGSQIDRRLRDPALLLGEVGRKLKPNEKIEGYVSFLVPEDLVIDKVIFRRQEKEIIFQVYFPSPPPPE